MCKPCAWKNCFVVLIYLGLFHSLGSSSKCQCCSHVENTAVHYLPLLLLLCGSTILHTPCRALYFHCIFLSSTVSFVSLPLRLCFSSICLAHVYRVTYSLSAASWFCCFWVSFSNEREMTHLGEMGVGRECRAEMGLCISTQFLCGSNNNGGK